MPATEATGAGGLSPRKLKIAAPAISASVSRLINHCITICSFPSKWKIAKISSIFKDQGSRKDKQNYRPISVLPVLSKLYERHVYDALSSNLTENNLLYGLQSGFRKRRSTETALIRLLDQILLDLDKNVSGLVCVDYSKAFDLIDHRILLARLSAYGVDEEHLQFFKSYLSGRMQYVEISGSRSASLGITYGVSQGSILGPLLLLSFLNDLPSVIPNSTADICVDDTFSSSSHYSVAPEEVQTSLQEDIDKLCRWTDQNQMVLNVSKTKSILVTGQWLQSRLECSFLTLDASGTEIEQVYLPKSCYV